MIEAIAIGIAVLGAVLLLILFSRIRQVDAELKLKKHRSKDAGLADLLNYAAVVDDGVIVPLQELVPVPLIAPSATATPRPPAVKPS